jgi:SAM-dependent MidA family methyltransferase
VLGRLREEIAAHHGWISFARYMEIALYEPGLGYYAGATWKLGAQGDFVTAPELGSLFGRTLARELKELPGPILEFGAGSGALAATLLSQQQRDYRIV